jgi:hypothetical protein
MSNLIEHAYVSEKDIQEVSEKKTYKSKFTMPHKLIQTYQFKDKTLLINK